MARYKKISRREREKQRQYDDMLEAALELFAEKGFHNVSMHEIANKAEFAIGTLYKFFNNKEDLYKALIMKQSMKFHTALYGALDDGKDEYTKLKNYIRAKGEVFRDNVKVVRLYFAETRGASFNIKSGLETEIKKRYEVFLQRLASVFKSGIQKGIFRDLDPYYLALSLDSLTNAFLFMWLENPVQYPYEMKMDLVEEIFFKGVAGDKFYSMKDS